MSRATLSLSSMPTFIWISMKLMNRKQFLIPRQRKYRWTHFRFCQSGLVPETVATENVHRTCIPGFWISPGAGSAK